MAKSQLTGGAAPADSSAEQAPVEQAPAPGITAEQVQQMIDKALSVPVDVLTREQVQEMIDSAITASVPTLQQLEEVMGSHFPTKDEFIVLMNDEIKRQVATTIEIAALPVPTPTPSGDAMADSAVADTAAREAAEAQATAAAKTEAAATKARAKATEDAQRSALADYEVALAGEGDLIDMTGAMRLRFGDGNGFIASLPSIDATPGAGMFVQKADQLVQATAIDFDIGQPTALVTEAWLISDTGSRKQEISGGLRVGAGAGARLPAGHLAFLIG